MNILNEALKSIGGGLAPAPQANPTTGPEPHNVPKNPLDAVNAAIGKAPDLIKLGEKAVQNPQGALSGLGTAYCVSERPDLYYGALSVGAGIGLIVTLFVALIVRALRGKAA